MEAFNSTEPGAPDLGRPQSASRTWFEPLLVVCIMLTSLWINRRRSYKLLQPRKRRRTLERNSSTDSLLEGEAQGRPYADSLGSLDDVDVAKRRCCGIPVLPPESMAKFESTPHSRVLQKFPFLVEMFYWALNFAAYSLTKKTASWLYGRSGNAVTAMAQEHGIAILNLEHHSFLSFLFPIEEAHLQAFFLKDHRSFMTFFNQIYSLVHIPGTVA